MKKKEEKKKRREEKEEKKDEKKETVMTQATVMRGLVSLPLPKGKPKKFGKEDLS